MAFPHRCILERKDQLVLLYALRIWKVGLEKPLVCARLWIAMAILARARASEHRTCMVPALAGHAQTQPNLFRRIYSASSARHWPNCRPPDPESTCRPFSVLCLVSVESALTNSTILWKQRFLTSTRWPPDWGDSGECASGGSRAWGLWYRFF